MKDVTSRFRPVADDATKTPWYKKPHKNYFARLAFDAFMTAFGWGFGMWLWVTCFWIFTQ